MKATRSDEVLGPEVELLLEDVHNVLLTEPCNICGGTGHEGGLKCSTVKILLEYPARLGLSSECQLLKASLERELSNFYNKSNFELSKQQAYQLETKAFIQKKLRE